MARGDPGAGEPLEEDTLLHVLDHLTTLSHLVTGTARASAADLDDLGNRVEHAVADLDELRQRVLRSLTVFDAVRLRAQSELAKRPALTDDEVDRIAAAVTDRLLDHVRIETERDRP